MMELLQNSASVSPTVSRIVVTLAERIRTGVYLAGEWLPSERELAADFKVSRILIRAAIKELERQQLIICAANRRPVVNRFSGVEVAPPGPRRSLAVWIWPDATWPPTGMVLAGIQAALGNEFRLVLGNSTGVSWDESFTSEARFLDQVCEDRDIEGLILGYMGGQRNRPQLEALRAANIAMVFVDHLPPEGFQADYVGVNNRYGMEQAAKYLLSIGHRNIAYVSNYDNLSTVDERLAGYRRALDRAGIAQRASFIERDPGPSGADPMEGCEPLVERLLGLADPPTAICAVNDVVAHRVIAALRAHGTRVPEDISVIGFDGIERWAPMHPFLSTLQQPFRRMGEQAVELVVDRLQNGHVPPYKHVILDVELVVHSSTRPLTPRAAPPYRA
jgi:LacI family transcriptional regulator